MSVTTQFIDPLFACPLGSAGWRHFEDICIDILKFLFVPPLSQPTIQARTYQGMDRRDAIFPNRNIGQPNNWGLIHQERSARFILFEFKNYDSSQIGKEEVDQTRNYLTREIGKLAIICCSKQPRKTAFARCHHIYSQEEKVVLFITKDSLKEMLFIKERDEDPSDLIMDLIESFLIEHQ